MAVPVKLNDPGYKNWLRACLGLQYLKEGIVDFVDAEVKQFHASIISNICNSGTCNQCNINTLTARKGLHACPNHICDRLCKEIEKRHRYTPCWKNADATKWCTDYWEIGKCFMSPGYTAVSKATDTDCTGLLSVCINGMFLPPTVTGHVNQPTNIFHKNRDARNVLLHSGSMSISDSERQDYIDDMIKLLANYKTPVDHVTQDAIDKLKELKSITVAILPDVELSILQSKIDAMTLGLIEVKEQIGTQKTDSDQHKEQVQSMLTEMERQINDHSDQHKAHIKNNADSLVALNQKIEELKRNTEGIAMIETTCRSLQGRIEDLNTQLLEIENRLSDHEAKLNTRLCDYDETKIENRLGDHATKIEKQETRIDEIRKYLDIKSTDRNPEQCVKDVQDFLVAKYKRDELHVQMSPLLQTYNAHIDEVYTELIVRNDLVHNPKRKDGDIRKNQNTEKRQNQKTIKTYREVLYDGKASCKNIYVLGMAGMGKTTWSRKLVATWIEAMENRGKEWKPNEDEAFLQEYDLVFYLSLRNARADRRVTKMIEHQLFQEDEYLLAAANTVLRKPEYSSKCIIILDGLDEWCSPDDDMSIDGLPVQDPTWKCSTITTTRSWKLEALQLERNKIDRAVEIQGLDTSGIDRLTDHVVAVLNQNSDKIKNGSEFQSQVSPSIRACMQVPLLLSIFVCLWHDDIRINEHLAGIYSDLLEMLIRYAEGNKRKRQIPKLQKEQLDNMKRIWCSENCSYPDCLSSKSLLVTYIPFLLRLGKLAFDTLLSSNLESMLVFDYESVQDLLCDTELDFSVKIGILSQTTQRRFACKETFSLSFLHKTVQEYLAALYMVSGDKCKKLESLKKFNSYCSSKMIVHEMDNVLLFVSGLCPETAGDVSSYLADMGPDIRIHQLLLRCWRESRVVSNTAANTTVSKGIYIKYHFMYGDRNTFGYSDDYNKDTVSYLRQAQDKDTSLYLNYKLKSKGYAVPVLDLSGCQALKTLECKGSSVPLRVPPSLEELSIEEYIIESKDLVLDLSECQKLKKLHYTTSTVPLHVPPSLCNLEDVEVWGYTGATGSLLDLSGCQSLRKLRYRGSILTLRLPSALHNLEEVRMKGYTGPAEQEFDISGCQLLRKFRYTKSTVPFRLSPSLHSLTEVVIKDYTGPTDLVLDLSECQSLRKLFYSAAALQLRIPNSLEEIAIKRYRGSSESVLDLSGFESLRKLEYTWSSAPLGVPANLYSLEEVILKGNTEYSESVLDFSGCHSLRKLQYTSSVVPLRVPPNLEEVTIWKYTVPAESVLDLSGCQSLRKLHYSQSAIPLRVPHSLENVTLEEYTYSTESLLDLSGCQSLKTLHYSHSTVPLQVPHSLEEVMIDGYRVSTESMLDLSGCQSLRKLHYTGSTVPLRVPFSLEEVLIEGYADSTGSMLDLSGCLALHTVNFKNSTVPLQLPTNLKEVVIERYEGSAEFLLDLSGCQTLTQLSIKSCTVQLRVPPSLEEVIIEKYGGSAGLALDLSGCETLRKLHYTYCSLPLSVPPSLEEATIKEYTGHTGSVLDLSACHSLRKLQYAESSVPVLVPTGLQVLLVWRYTVSTKSVLDLSGCQSLKRFRYTQSTTPLRLPSSLEEVVIDEYTVSKETELDFSGCQFLRKLKYTRSTVQLRIPSSLWDIRIEGYRVSTESVLDLSKCQTLRKLHYTKSTVPLRLAPTLEEIRIRDYEGPAGSVLDLTECLSLKYLDYKSSSAPLRIHTKELMSLKTDRQTAGLIQRIV